MQRFVNVSRFLYSGIWQVWTICIQRLPWLETELYTYLHTLAIMFIHGELIPFNNDTPVICKNQYICIDPSNLLYMNVSRGTCSFEESIKHRINCISNQECSQKSYCCSSFCKTIKSKFAQPYAQSQLYIILNWHVVIYHDDLWLALSLVSMFETKEAYSKLIY